MRLHTSVIILRLTALAALGVLGVFIFGVDPSTLTVWGQTLFFSSLFFLIFALVVLILLALAEKFLNTEMAQAYQLGALRQGTLIGLFLTGVALAQFLGYLTWWLPLLALALALLVEFTFRRMSPS